MKIWLESPLVERLGWALLHSLWQITVIALVLGLLRLVFRQPRIRHTLAMFSLLACVIWPAATLMQSWPKPLLIPPAQATTLSPASILVESLAVRTPRTETLGALAETQGHTASHRSISWRALLNRAAPWAAGSWLSGLGLLLLRHAGALVVLHGLKRKAVSATAPALQSLFDELKCRLGVHRAARLLVSAKVLTPMIIGTLRPVVLVPAALATGLDPAQLEALLAHELAHLRRWDDVVNLVQCAIETLLFFHPAVWWMSRRAREDRELCCDDLAIARGVERATLAEALGRLALWHMDAPQPVLAASGHGPVAARIHRLLQPSAPRFSASVSAWPLLLVLLAALPLAPIKPSHAEDQAKPPRGRILDRNGVVLAESDAMGTRHYPQKTVATHVIGYTGITKPGEVPFGRTGIEESCEKTLAARDDVTLTLDADLQRSVEDILADKATSGACVVMNPNTGEVLSLASWPTYDLNLFVPRISADEYQRLSKDPAIPLLGRAFQGSYFPASNFKLVTALAGLQSGAIDEKTIFNGDASLTIGDRVYRNWNKDSEGPLDLTGAIRRSCNTWFYQAALKTGSGPMIAMAQDLGFGKPSGLPLRGEAKGFVPTDAYYKERLNTQIGPGILASMSIGQVVEASPVQVAVATSAIANGGTVLTPRLTTREPAGQVRHKLNMDPQHLAAVRRGMLAAVNDDGGTGHNASLDRVQVAGKTGSAQWKIYSDSNRNRHLAWFTCFAPFLNPQVVVTAAYEGKPGEAVSGGGSAAPIAKAVLEKALQRLPANPLPNAAGTVEVRPLADRFNTAWFASATMELMQMKVGDPTEARLFLPPPQAVAPASDAALIGPPQQKFEQPRWPRYDLALLLTPEKALLYQGNVRIDRADRVVTIQKSTGKEVATDKAFLAVLPGAPAFRGSIHAGQAVMIDRANWPPLWSEMLTQLMEPTTTPTRTFIAREALPEPNPKPLPARLGFLQNRGSAYQPQTLLMPDGSTQGFVNRSAFPPAIGTEAVQLTPLPATPTPKLKAPPPLVPPSDLQSNDHPIPPQLRDVETYKRLSPGGLSSDEASLHLPDLSPAPLEPRPESPFPKLPKTSDLLDPLPSGPTPVREILDAVLPSTTTTSQATPPPAKAEAFVIGITSEGQIWVEEKILTKEALADRLAKLDKEQPVIVRGRAATQYGKIMEVLELCQKAGRWNVSFATPASATSPPPVPKP